MDYGSDPSSEEDKHRGEKDYAHECFGNLAAEGTALGDCNHRQSHLDRGCGASENCGWRGDVDRGSHDVDGSFVVDGLAACYGQGVAEDNLS